MWGYLFNFTGTGNQRAQRSILLFSQRQPNNLVRTCEYSQNQIKEPVITLLFNNVVHKTQRIVKIKTLINLFKIILVHNLDILRYLQFLFLYLFQWQWEWVHDLSGNRIQHSMGFMGKHRGARVHDDYLLDNTFNSSSCICSSDSGNGYMISQGIEFSTAWDLWENIVALVCMTIIFLIISYIQLRRIKKYK